MRLLLITLHAQGQHCWAVFHVIMAQTKSWEAPTLPWKPTYYCMMQPCGGWPQTQELLIWVVPASQVSGGRTSSGASSHFALSKVFWHQQKSSITSVSVWNSVGCSSWLIWAEAKAIKAQVVWIQWCHLWHCNLNSSMCIYRIYNAQRNHPSCTRGYYATSYSQKTVF